MSHACRHCGVTEVKEHWDICIDCSDVEKERVKVLFDGNSRLQGIRTLYVLLFAKERKSILTWEFHEAPEPLRELSTNGGDEDWLVYVPASVQFPCGTPSWLERISADHSPDEFLLPDGARVFIGSHS